MRAPFSFSNQIVGACLSSYKNLCNLHINVGDLGSLKLRGCSMNTSSCKLYIKKMYC